MELHQIKYFLALVRERNFTKAAEACNVSQPSLTRGIRKLEADLGGLLFERKLGGTGLTDLGRLVLPRLDQAYGAVSEVINHAHEFTDAKKRRLRLGLVCTIGPQRLVDVLVRLDRRQPDVELMLSEAKSPDVIEQLLAGDIDVAIACQPSYPEEISVTTLFRERFAIAFRPGHRFQALKEVSLDEVIGENYLERLNCEFDDYYATHFGDRPFPLNIRYSSEREDWVQAMILVGLGISFVPESLPLLPGILTVPITQPEMWREIALLTVRGRPHSIVTDSFVRVVTSHRW